MSSIRGRWTSSRVLAATALLLGSLAMIAGDPPGVRAARTGEAAVANGAEQDAAPISAIELARMIRDRTPGLRVIDLRSDVAPNAYRIPGAELMRLTDLASTSFESGETIVLYSDDDSKSAQAGELLRARGHERRHVLRGGLFAWIDEVMEARITSDADERERTAFREIADLSRYFGGQPVITDLPGDAGDAAAPSTIRDPGGSAKSARDAVRRLERRGC